MKPAAPLTLAGRPVGDGHPAYVICEAGVTNYGEIALARLQLDAAVAAACDAVKYQAWKTENLVSKKVSARLKDELGYDWFERLKYKELSDDELRQLRDEATKRGMTFFATPHDGWAVDFLDKKLGVPFFKIGSGESNNPDFLRDVGGRGKPVLISFGLQSDTEVLEAVSILRSAGAKDIGVFHCVSQYPTEPENVNLRRIAELRELTGLPVGISDHSRGFHLPLAAVALGACMVEKHLTFDKADPRSVDNPGALLPEEFTAMVAQIRDLEAAMRPQTEAQRTAATAAGRSWAGSAIVALRDLPAGTVVSRADIGFKRPGKGGIPPNRADEVVGKRLKTAVPEDEHILSGHLE